MKTKTLKLITEAANDLAIVKQEKDPSKPFTMKYTGVFAESSRKNANGRTYPYELLKSEIERFDKEMVQTGRALSELEHPENPTINPDNVCARILSLTEDNKAWVGEGIVLCSDEKFNIKGTPKGDLLAALTNYGTKWGMSTRALGDVDESTGEVTDLRLTAIDCVLDPSIGQMCTSDGNRFVNGILESKQFICNVHGEVLEECFNRLEKNLSKMPNTYISSKKNEKVFAALSDFFKSFSRMS